MFGKGRQSSSLSLTILGVTLLLVLLLPHSGLVFSTGGPSSGPLPPEAWPVDSASPLPSSGSPPDPPTFPSPADMAVGVPANPMLCADVSDPEGDLLDVTFYGRPVTTGPGPDFTIIALPDTQFYSQTYPWVFLCQTEWVLDEGISPSGSCTSAPPAHGLNVIFTTQLGDCVQSGSATNTIEWDNANAALSVFDPTGNEEKMPFGVAVGNHDQGPTGNGDPGVLGDGGATTFLYNQTFGVARFAGRSYYGGSFEPGVNDNHYELFSASGMDFIIIHMEYDQAASSPLRNAVLAWADGLLTTHSDRRAIIVSHYVVTPSGGFSTQGQAVYDALKGHANWFLMLGGHANEAARRTDPVGPTLSEGTLTSIMSDYQGGANGGNGWLRIMTFSPANDQVTVQTYSPWLDQFKPDTPPPGDFNAHNFVIPYDMESGLPFQQIGSTVAGVSSGGTACVDWPGRQAGAQYEWFVEISDSTSVTTGPRWSFTSDGACSFDTDCDDGDICTTGGSSGSCVAGFCDIQPIANCCVSDSDCNDGNACTDEVCNLTTNQCEITNNTNPCDDGDLCTLNDICSGGSCSGTANTCDDGNACTVDSCNAGVCDNAYSPAPGCCLAATDCDDGFACTADSCNAGACGNVPIQDCCDANTPCDDGDVCTADACLTPNTSALAFNGSTDYVTMGVAPGLNAAQFTVEFWVKRTGTGTTATSGTGGFTGIPLVTKGVGEVDGDTRDLNYFVGINDAQGGILAADFEEHTTGSSPGLNHPVFGSTPLMIGVWYHAAATYDGTTWTLYLNGNVDGTASPNQPPNFDSIQHFGLGTALSSTGGANGRFHGLLDEVRVWNRALGQSEIQAGMNSQITTDPDLLGRWGLNEASGSTAFDSSGPAENGTIVGSASWELSDLAPLDAGTCEFTPIPGCCLDASDCDDGNACTTDVCNAGTCESTYTPAAGCCLFDADCDDGDACTIDACDGTNSCVNTADPNCCVSDFQCDDGNACTIDFCPEGTNTAALSFDGAGDRVAMGPAPALNSATFTLEAWFQWNPGGATANSGTGGIIAYPMVTKGVGESDAATLNLNYFLGILASGQLAADFEEHGTGTSVGLNHPVTGTTSLTAGDGLWHHAAVTYDGTCWQLYLDGNADTDGTNCPAQPPDFDSIQHFGLGVALNSSGTASGAFSGLLDEVRVWGRALTGSEILANMDREIITDIDLLGRWGLNEGAGALAADSSGNGNDGTITGATWINTGLIDFGTANLCENLPIAGCCLTQADCDDGDLCTSDTCDNNACVSTPIANCCVSDLECSDGDGCTADACVGNTCTFTPAPDCCLADVDCDDLNACTADACVLANSAALSFDGSGDYVAMGPAPGLGAAAFTLEAWVHWSGGGATASSGSGGVVGIPLIAKGRGEADGSNLDANYFFAVNTSGNLVADFEDLNSGLNHPVTGGQIVSTNAWHHVAVTYDGNCWQLYLDGVADPAGTNCPNQTPRFDSIQHFALGSALSSTGAAAGSFSGLMDEARVWSRALSQAEIQANLNTQLVAGDGLIARWGLNEGAGTNALDSVGFNDGVITGASWESVNIRNLGTNSCSNAPIPDCCVDASDCSDGDVCTAEACVDNQCESTPIAGCCLIDSDCDDGDPCTDDSCNGLNQCDNTPRTALCDDLNSCTDDSCIAAPNPSAIAFDGNGDYLSFGTAGSHTHLGLATFTAEAWFKRTGVGVVTGIGPGASAVPLVAKGRGVGDGSNIDLNYFLGIMNGVIVADFESFEAPGGNNNHTLLGTTTIQNDVWYHAAMTYDGATLRVYLNGAEENALTTSDTPRNDSILPFGIATAFDQTATPVAGGFFAGVVDDVRVWDHARTAQQISDAMDVRLDATPGLVGGWRLDEGTGTTTVDFSGNGISGTLNGESAWVTNMLVSLAGCQNTVLADGTGCDDGDLCTTTDQCSGGLCGGTVQNCDDGVSCTADSCDPGTGSCINSPQDAFCADGDVCTADICDPVLDCTNPAEPDGTSCDDGNLCSGADSCQGGVCTGTPIPECCVTDLQCDDGNACTIDFCPQTSNLAALSFDGSGDRVAMGQAPGLGAATFTLEAWVNWNGGGDFSANSGTGGVSGAPIIAKGRGEADGNNRDANYFFAINTSGRLVADFEEHSTGTSPGLNHPVTGGQVLPTNAWHHVAVTYDGSCWQLYLDGVADPAGTNCPGQPPRFDSIQHFALGSALTSTGAAAGSFSGLMDEARVWRRALSGTEIRANMNRQIASDPDLLGRWGLNEGIGTTAGDSTGNGHTGTVTGAIWVTTGLVDFGTANVCRHDTIPDCCASDADCNDGDACTADTCVDNACVVAPIADCCAVDGDCDDGNACTTDACVANSCENTPIPDCCLSDAECDDGSACTIDQCIAPNTSALSFNNPGDYVTMGRAPGLGTATFTLETWVNWDGGGVTASSGSGGVVGVPLIAKGVGEADGDNRDANYFFAIATSGNLVADFENNSTGLNHPVTGGQTVPANAWHHVAVTYDGSCWQLYLDGVADPAGTNCPGQTPRADSIQHFGLGAALNSTGAATGAFSGLLDEARVWNRALSQAEIQANMNVQILADPDLLGRWGLNDGTGSAAIDSSSNANHGLLRGSPTWTTTGLLDFGPGACTNIVIPDCCEDDAGCADADLCTVETCAMVPSAAAIALNGTSAYVAMGRAPRLGASTFTLELWFNWNGGGATASSGGGGVVGVPLIAKGVGEADGDNRDANYFFAIDAAGRLVADFESTDPAPNNFPVQGSLVVTTGTWHHAAATYDGTCWQLYLNGVADPSGTSCPARTPRFDSIQHFALGAALTSTGARNGAFNGRIDEARVWNYARSTQQIADGMHSEIESAAGLLGRWGLNEGTGTSAADSSGNGNAGTLTGATWSTTDLIGFKVCSSTPVVCDDGNVCNGLETCDPASGCQPGTPLSCDDGNVCTGDSCDPVNGCVNTPLTGQSCADGDVCNGDEVCDAAGVCQPGTPLICDNGQFCDGLETCDPASGCQPGTAPPVDDGVACTDDSCDEVNDVIVNAANDANCDNGLFCDGAETCDAVNDCQPGTAPPVDDGVACTDDSCDEVNDVIVNAPNDGACNDGNVCTDDACDPTLDCVNTSNTAPCDDGNACTSPDICAGGTCVGQAAPDDTTCDGVDDDCDGLFDEDFVPTPTTCGLGVCAGQTGVTFCAAGTIGDTCDPFAGATPEGVVVEFGSSMKYLPNSTDPGIGLSWTGIDPGFDDATWADGRYGVGYENSPPNATALITTPVPSGTFSVFTRVRVNVPDRTLVTRLVLGADYDDAFAVWINGVEVHRSPEIDPLAAIVWNTNPALHESSNSLTPNYGVPIDVSAIGIPALVDGENLLAVGVWNTNAATSSDLVLVPRLSVVVGEPLCDGVDNDCDGLVDEDLDIGGSCTVGLGGCQATGTKVCGPDGLGTVCDAVPLAPTGELCDGIDNDCDGTVDEDFPSLGQSCTVGVGACTATGTLVCSTDGLGTVCDGVPGNPTTEVCDGIDNDCDGIIDDGVLQVGATATMNPNSLNVNGQGKTFEINVSLTNVCNPANPLPLDPSGMTRAYIVRAGTSPDQPDPFSFTCPAPPNNLGEFGIVENLGARTVNANRARVTFNTPPDGFCNTLDGDRQDLIALLSDFPDGGIATVCIRSRIAGVPFDACANVVVRNRGNR